MEFLCSTNNEMAHVTHDWMSHTYFEIKQFGLFLLW